MAVALAGVVMGAWAVGASAEEPGVVRAGGEGLNAVAKRAASVVGGAEAASDDAKTDAEPLYFQFRDLFDRKGRPNPRAVGLSGSMVEMIGFVADAPSDESPFLVFVGAPSEFCPYCQSIDDLSEHPPYILVYPTEEVRQYGSRERIRVTGRIEASHGYENTFGIHNDVRLWQAEVRLDQRARRPGDETRHPQPGQRRRAAQAPVLDPDE